MIEDKIEERIALFEIMLELSRDALDYFKNPNAVLIMYALAKQQFEAYHLNGKFVLTKGYSVRELSEITGLSKSTVHDQLTNMLYTEVFTCDGKYYSFALNEDGAPVIAKLLPDGPKAMSNYFEKMECIMSQRAKSKLSE